MKKRTLAIASTFAVVATSVFGARTLSAPSVQEFEDLSITLQVNETDQELAVIIAMEVAEEFLGFEVVDPAGNTRMGLRTAYPLGIGVHECALEAKSDPANALAAFPEGAYRVTAYTAHGDVYQGEAWLSHDLPDRPRFTRPAHDGTYSHGDLPVCWLPTDSEEVTLEVEGEDLLLEVTLPGDVTSFVVPAAILAPDSEYEVDLTAVAENGNVVTVEEVMRTTR